VVSFDGVNHGWMKTFLQHRIGDPRIIELIWRMLKGGILEDGLVRATEEGTPQGSVITPRTQKVTFNLNVW
jgi:RNA-directed DNA polymerase